MNYSTIARTLSRGIRLSVAAALLVGSLAVTQPAQADVIVVTNAFSLRAAITQANSNPGPDTINFHPEIDGTPIILAGSDGENANAYGDLDILGAHWGGAAVPDSL